MTTLKQRDKLFNDKRKDYPYYQVMQFDSHIDPIFADKVWKFTFVSIPFKERGEYVYMFKTAAELSAFNMKVKATKGTYKDELEKFKKKQVKK